MRGKELAGGGKDMMETSTPAFLKENSENGHVQLCLEKPQLIQFLSF